jgi:hypothetical protein
MFNPHDTREGKPAFKFECLNPKRSSAQLNSNCNTALQN